LHAQVFRELETYSKDAMLDIVCIQEARWNYDANWTGPDFHFIHSAGKAKEDVHGGVLIMISTKVAARAELQFNIVHPGRMLHVRINKACAIDVLNLYQYTANDNKLTPERRQHFLKKLHSTLRGIPSRHSIFMAGDMNSTCMTQENVCGKWVLPSPARQQDNEDLMAILSTYALTALNTWHRPTHGQLATFTFGESASQIDYIFCKQCHARNRAKHAEVLPQFPVACWRDGAKHHPVLAQISVPYNKWQSPPHKSKVDVADLISDMRATQEVPRLRALRQEVRQGIQAQQWTDMDTLEEGILHIASRHYPPARRPTTVTEADYQLANSARHMWALFRDMRSLAFTATGVFHAWRQWVRFTQAHKVHKSRSRARSKAWRRDLLLQAQQAANSGDMHKVWKVVKALAPKTKRKTLQLYRNGHIMAPEAELNWIISEFGDRYGARQAPQATGKHREQHPVQISASALQFELDHLPVRKAVPSEAAPSAVWKACSLEVADFITNQINQRWRQDTLAVPQRWADASVALLPKPKNKNDAPLDWRPIGLQHPIGKSIMRLVIIAQAKDQIHRLVQEWPQCAYVPHRSTTTALKRVYRHCSSVRAASSQHRLTIHQKKEQLEEIPNSGGLQVSMDLSAAFDLVPWGAIKEAMELAQVEPSIQELLLQWLGQVRYRFQHRGLEKDIWPSWGLRQGRIGSPILWAAFTALLSRAIDARVQATRPTLQIGCLQDKWCAEHATLYADDSHLQWEFRSYEQFERSIAKLKLVFAVFRRMGMKVNNNKTQAIMSLTGPMKHKIQAKYVRKQGTDRHLLLSAGDPTTWIMLVDKAEYLGMVISYDGFESQTVQHRLSKAHQRRWAMASILHTRHMSVAYKLSLWKSCVLSTMMYAMHCLCLRSSHIRALQKAIMRHVRAIVSDQAFLTGTTHEEIMMKYKIESALQLLNKAHSRELGHQNPEDWMLVPDWDEAISTSLHSAATDDGPNSDAEREIWACPVCDEQFVNPAALKIHARRKHHITEQAVDIFDKSRHAIGGMPQCAGCRKKFSRWQTLRNHINNNSCPGTASPAAHAPAPKQPQHQEPPETSQANSDSAIDLVIQAKGTHQQQVHAPTDSQNASVAIELTKMDMHDSVKSDGCHDLSAPDPAHSTIPLIQQSPVQRLVEKGLNAFIGQKQLTDCMLQNCVICGQWIASQKVMKRHYQHSHSTLYSQLQKTTQQLISQRATPCSKCHSAAEITRPMYQVDEEMDAFFGSVHERGDLPPLGTEPRTSDLAIPTKINDNLLATLHSTSNGQDSIMHHLYQAAMAFKAKQEAEPQWQMGQMPLRMVLAIALFRELTDRLNSTLASQEKLKRVTDQGWRDDKGWRFQVWNRTLKHLEVDKARAPIPDDQILDHLATILQCLRHPIVTRFCCTRKVTETMSSAATYKMDLSLRSHSAVTMWDTIKMLQGNVVFQLVGMAYKTDSLARSPAEQRILDMLYGRRG
ncbi:unnamed protein product, partial [Symbiodinium sp. CCMP2456]